MLRTPSDAIARLFLVAPLLDHDDLFSFLTSAAGSSTALI